jgi:hypothetical protein
MSTKQLDDTKHTQPNKAKAATVASAGKNRSKSTTAPYSLKNPRKKK